MTPADLVVSRLLLALGMACFLTAAVYAIQARFLDVPAAPWLGSTGFVLVSAYYLYGFIVKRSAGARSEHHIP